MAQGITSNRYAGPGSILPSGKAVVAKGDNPFTHTKALKSGKGGSTKKRQVKPKR